MKKLEDDLTSEDAMNAPLHEVEQMLRTQGREMLRAMMQAHLIGAASRSGPWRSVARRHRAGAVAPRNTHGDD